MTKDNNKSNPYTFPQTLASSPTTQFSVEQAYQLAAQYFNANNIHQAEVLCRQILQTVPHYSDALHLLGIIAAQTGHFNEAEQLISQAIAINSTVLNYHENLVKVYQQQNKSELANKHWHKFVEYPQWINNYDTLTEDNIVYLRSQIQEWENPPQISLLIYVDSHRESGLLATVESIKNQIYPYWEMYIVASASTPPNLRQLLEQQASEDHRIQMAFQELHTTTVAYNHALNLAKGDYLALIDCGDLLPHHALYFIAGTIVARPEVMLIYSDEDKINEQNQRIEPYFKCDWNPDLFLSQNFVKHLAVYKTELIRNVGGFRESFEDAHDYDIALRAIEQISPIQIQHFPHVLYHQRVSDQFSAVKEVPFRILEAAKMAVRDHLNRRGLVAAYVEEAFNCPGQLRVRYPLPPKLPLVSIIIPTYNHAKLLQTCVGSILAKTDYANFEIIIIDNRSDEAETLAYLEYLQTHSLARIIQYPHPFNFAAINNFAVEYARGEFILFLNNDTKVIHEGWLAEMVSQALRPEIGVVGVRLWHSNNTLQHAGVVLGVGAPGFAHIAGHAHKWLPRGQGGYFGRAQLLQNFSAVTGACMMLRKSVFMAAGGFNSQDLAVAYNDVDLCLKIQDKLGLRILWTPYAELYHDEMKSRGYDDTPDRQARLKAETLYLQKRWRERLMNDPAYSPNLTVEADNFSIAFPSRRSHAVNRFYGNRLLDIVDRKVPELDKLTWLSYALNHFLPTAFIPHVEINDPIDIIIPIFNGYEYLIVLIPAIINHTTLPYRVILFDDASTDQRVGTYLREIHNNHSQFLYIRAEKNLGFVGAVNNAYQYVQFHFVLLNQDTEVPPHWLERLMYPIVTNPSIIASTTPFTNAGTICSFPNFLQDNPLFNNLNVIELDKFFQPVKITGNYVEIPTGVGFCMGMNKTVVEQVGLFNEQLFGRGYGEENDWCMRAKKAGYKNIIVPNLLVYHKHGGVFSSPEKEQLKRDNFAKQVRLHPEYPGLVEDFIKRDPLKVLREFLIIQISAASAATGAVLIIDHDIGGGANIFRKKIMGKWIVDNRPVLLLTYSSHYNIFKMIFQKESHQFEYKFESFIEIRKLFHLVRISEVHINEVVTLEKPLEIVSIVTFLKKNFNPSLVFYLHDYFSICPSYVLINDQGVYCEVPAHLETCQNCLANNFGEFRGFVERESIDIIKWRAVWGDFLAVADKIVCFSNSSKEILRTAYQSLPAEKIIVSPHKVEGFFPLKFVPKRGTLHIGVVGSINFHKGLEILKQMVKLLEDKNYDAKIILIGQASEAISSDKVIITGEYKREELPSLIKKHNITMVFIPSICPETFSFTTDEIMMMELPLAVFDIGAPPERVRNYKRGLVIEKIDAAYALEELLKFGEILSSEAPKNSNLFGVAKGIKHS